MCLAAASSAAGRQESVLLMCMQATHVAAGGNVCAGDVNADSTCVLLVLCPLHVLNATCVCTLLLWLCSPQFSWFQRRKTLREVSIKLH